MQSELIQFFYNPKVNTEAQQIDSAVVRIRFDVNQQPIRIANLKTPIQILIPKLDQSFANATSNISCLSWDEGKQIWDEGSIIQS